MTQHAPACREMIDHRRYPVEQPHDPVRQRVVARVRAALAGDGCAVLRGFFSPTGLAALLEEARARSPRAYYSPSKLCNVYFGATDRALPPDHPRNVLLPRSNGFVTADLFGADTAARRLYNWPALKTFLADCLGKQELFLYDDPVSNMIVNVSRPGEQFNWHFDTNQFTITMLLQAAGAGGYFEYTPGLRTPADECYEAVGKVLAGDRTRVRRLRLNAGDLQFFLGRYALHRVTENSGECERLLLIMSFCERPGMVGARRRVRDLYGKTAAAHGEPDRVRADGLLD